MDRKDRKNTMKLISLKNKEGFTLIELLIAMLILAIGLIAVASLLVTAIHGNASAKWVTGATTFAEKRIEELRGMGFTGLAQYNNRDWITDPPLPAGAGTFSRQWQITTPQDNLRLIEVRVTWRDIGGRERQVDLATYIAR